MKCVSTEIESREKDSIIEKQEKEMIEEEYKRES